MQKIKLTQFSHGGGCGCKISPAILQQLLANIPTGVLPNELLIGSNTADDAAVYKLNERQAIIATTDFFTPIVDDPYDFGQIAATNALSDIYAMGGKPIMALAIVGMPLDKLPIEVISQILAGGASICQKAGIPIAGGHSIDILEPVYGLVAIGVVDPKKLLSNATAQIGDTLVLTKPLGIGMLSAALKKGLLTDADYDVMVKLTTTLNMIGSELCNINGVHAMTDVTGFGLAGHLLEMCRGAKLQATINFAQLPILEPAINIAKQGIATGASNRNWQSYGKSIIQVNAAEIWQRNLLTDPQTSGGLLIACDGAALSAVNDVIKSLQGHEGYVIGRMSKSEPQGAVFVE
ncbi:selenide, water dikinase SelD [Orbus sturtevantii]|uniref:selenide, water dikinase SelD n=1 Tax=Orbus sturtevantii TaxID=3074109 RepID=UPI00370D287E